MWNPVVPESPSKQQRLKERYDFDTAPAEEMEEFRSQLKVFARWSQNIMGARVDLKELEEVDARWEAINQRKARLEEEKQKNAPKEEENRIKSLKRIPDLSVALKEMSDIADHTVVEKEAQQRMEAIRQAQEYAVARAERRAKYQYHKEQDQLWQKQQKRRVLAERDNYDAMNWSRKQVLEAAAEEQQKRESEWQAVRDQEDEKQYIRDTLVRERMFTKHKIVNLTDDEARHRVDLNSEEDVVREQMALKFKLIRQQDAKNRQSEYSRLARALAELVADEDLENELAVKKAARRNRSSPTTSRAATPLQQKVMATL
eukprot:TRINITY_DN68055_c1_g1_i1.p1 TRINITY_DN68055_c1_g1~~TRINITY_DN68055_c1_g1_i1.p1  ORF type:complete len:316 (-),score=57.09 TRINITY_DN68055_c1_g1_i1:344-1291(-)